MKDRDRPEDATLPIVGIIGAAIVSCLLVIAGAQRLQLPLIASDDSVFGIVSGIIGITGLAIGGYGVYLSHRASSRSHEHAYGAQMGNLFKDGAELLSSERTTAQLSGMAVLSELAKDEPQRYLVPILKALAGYISQINSEAWAETKLWSASPAAFSGPWKSSDLRTVDALVTIAQLAPRDCAWPIHPSISYKNRLVVEQLYACDMFVEEETFDNVHFRRMIARRVRFYKCSFRNSVVHLAAAGDVIFEECDLTDAIMAPTNAELQPVAAGDLAFTLKNCETAGLSIGGVPFESWKKLDVRSLGFTSQRSYSPQWFPELVTFQPGRPAIQPKSS